MNSRFIVTKAKRGSVKARIGLTGATNTGKTWTALLIAAGLLKAEGYILENGDVDWSKVCVIDTERERALFYANNGTFGEFSHIDFKPPYNPKDYIEAVNIAYESGAKVIIIDSISHAWSGSGGVLEYVAEKAANSKTKNTFNEGWGGKEGGTALQNAMVDKILATPCHIIATFRQKMEYVQERDENGKTKITKVGVKPVQKEDLEYEFDITLKLSNDHTAEIIKNTVNFINENEFTSTPITEAFGIELGKYLSTGADAEELKESKRKQLIETIYEMGRKEKALVTFFQASHPDWNLEELTLEQCITVINEFKGVLN